MRKPISKKLRFEIFKRDSFTCQYCGAKSPDVILEIDHINPIKEGGNNDILNLITSCFNCNRGKSSKKINDNSVIKKQQNQLEQLNKKREQLELMLQWREELNNIQIIEIKEAIKYWNSQWKTYSLSEHGEENIKKLIKKQGLSNVLKAIDITIESYKNSYKKDNEKEIFELALSKLGGVLNMLNKPELDKKIAYVKGICRNRFQFFDTSRASILLQDYINALKSKNWSEDDILTDFDKEVIPITKEKNNWSSWRKTIENWIIDIKNW